jgi:CubicO group peptidase (beta-lactamase class C family)
LTDGNHAFQRGSFDRVAAEFAALTGEHQMLGWGRIRPSVTVIVFLLLVAPLTPAVGLELPEKLRPSEITAIRALIEKTLASEGAPGATFGIGLDGKLVWSAGFGQADLENDVPATADTAYRTASIGKALTATAAMGLAEQGKLDLDVPIQKYCPRFPKKRWPITARDLISHTSGIRHYGGPHEESELYNTKHYDHVSDAIDLFKDDPLKQQPGSDFLYSTWGYVTLGCVLEGASGEEYRSLIRRLIFDPAGMASTRDDDPRALIQHRARGYILENGELKNSRWVDMSSKMAAGGWITTAPDLVRFMNWWMDGRFVSPQTMSLMLRPFVLRDGKSTVDNFGLGWFIDDYHGMKAGLYGGGTPQVSGVVFFVPEKRLAVAGIFNLENISGPKRIALAELIADIVLGEKSANPDHFTPR